MLRDILENFSNATATRATYATSGVGNDNGVARIARVQVATPREMEIDHNNEILSNWWMIHYLDHESVQVAIWPPCHYADVIALNPKALAAEAISSPINDEAVISSLGDINE